jgi:anti-anti-sigma factor
MLKPTVRVQDENGVLVAEFWDCLRLDTNAVQDLRGKYEAHVKSGGRPEVVVDLVGVGFAGSAALGHFVALHRVARAKNGRLIFCNVDPNVLEVFKVSKLEPLFKFVSDRAEALATARGHGTDAPASAPVVDGPAGAANSPPASKKMGGDGLLRSRVRRKLS